MVEPELPQSRGSAAAANVPPVPVTATDEPLRSTFAPSASAHARLLAQSAPVEKLVKCEVPWASAPNSA